VKDLIKDNPELMEELEAKIKDKVKVDDSALLDKDVVAE
jgi:recombination protein RecA